MSSKSSRNAVTHGIFTSVLVLRNENDEDFLRLEAQYNGLYHPVGPLERNLVDQMIAADWRLRPNQQPAAPQSDTNNLKNEVRS